MSNQSVSPPILRVLDEGEEEVNLPLPNDEESYNYTKMEVIEMSITYKKQDVVNAIVNWGNAMKKRFRCPSGVRRYGPGKTTLKKFFPNRQSDPFPDDVVDYLLRGLPPGSEPWRRRVESIVRCECHAPNKAGIYSRCDVPLREDNNEDGESISSQTSPFHQIPCVTPENSEATTPGGSTAQAFTFSESSYINGNQWTPEEEAFAELLFREFDDGIIPITPGTGITDFLASALRCSRNRVSKKYGNEKGIKQMTPFQRRPSWVSLPYSDMVVKLTALRDLEEGFMKSKFDDLQKPRPDSIFGSIPTGIDKCGMSPETNGTFYDTMLVNLVKANPEFSTAITDTDMGLVGNLKRWPIIWSILADYKKNASDGNEVAATMPSLIETDEEGTTILNNFDCLKDQANSLDFEAIPRKTRDGARRITLHDKKLPTPDLRSRLIYFTCRVMRETGLDSSMETEVEELVAKILFYDFGYKSVAGFRMGEWSKKLDCGFLNGFTADDTPLKGNYKGRPALADSIERSNPGMMRKLFLKTQEELTAQASFKELAEAMTKLAATDEMGNKEWKFSAYIVRTWFNKNGGKLKSPKAKPFLTEDQKKARLEWCEEQKMKLSSVEKTLEDMARKEELELLSDEEESASEVDEEVLYGPESLNLNDTLIECAAGRHCCMPRASLPPLGRCRTCINCDCDMHGICGVVFDDFLTSGFEIREDSLSQQGLSYLDEERERDETIAICLKCCKELTDGEYKADGRKFYMACLDEKWCYTDSQRRKIKELPRLPGETPVSTPKCISRRNAVKVMFLGVVANPEPDRDFDGKIYLRRVSETQKYGKMTCNQNFSNSAPVNEALKNGDWKQHVQEGMTLQTLRTTLQEKYNIDDSITGRLVIQYKTLGRDGKEKPAYVDAETDTVPSGDSLAIGDYTLKVKYKKGDDREQDITCDSKFMLGVMHDVGKAIRKAYHWVSIYWPIFLYLDNAGGHGTKEAVQTYVNFLRTEYNVICVHQRPRSPETNMLDLGVWMAMQSVVEKMHVHRRYHVDALAITVYNAWEELEPIKLRAVYERWVKVLDLIILDNGGNDQVESRRGKLFSVPTIEVEGNEQVLAVANGSTAEGMTSEEEEFFEEEDDHHSGCCAGRHCIEPELPVPTTHKCLNCGLHVHGICLVEWDQLSSKGYDISKSSLTKEGQKYLDENHTLNDICLQCIEELKN